MLLCLVVDFNLFSIKCGVLWRSGVSGGKYQKDATIKARTFVVRDFVIGTSDALVATVSVEGTDVKVCRNISWIINIPELCTSEFPSFDCWPNIGHNFTACKTFTAAVAKVLSESLQLLSWISFIYILCSRSIYIYIYISHITSLAFSSVCSSVRCLFVCPIF